MSRNPSYRFCPCVEDLEGRALLSATLATGDADFAVDSQVSQFRSIDRLIDRLADPIGEAMKEVEDLAEPGPV